MWVIGKGLEEKGMQVWHRRMFLVPQRLIEHLLCARYHTRCWEQKGIQGTHDLCPRKLPSYRRTDSEHLLEGAGQARKAVPGRKGGLSRKGGLGIAEPREGGSPLHCGLGRFPGSCGFTQRWGHSAPWSPTVPLTVPLQRALTGFGLPSRVFPKRCFCEGTHLPKSLLWQPTAYWINSPTFWLGFSHLT